MRSKNRWFQLVLFVLLFTFPTMLFAQEELTQTFTSADGLFTMSYPAGWTVEEDDLIRFSSDQAFMQVSFHDYGEEISPLEVLEIGTPVYLGFSVPEELVVAGYDAVRSASEDQHHTVINFCGGIMALAIGYVQPGDMPAFAPTFSAMLDTIRYGEGEPVFCRSAFADLAPITAGNAAQVAQVMTFGDESVPVESVTFSSEGKIVAAGAQDGTVHLWSLLTSEELHVLRGHRDGATSVAFVSGDYNLASGAGNGQVQLWDVTYGTLGRFLQKHSTAVESVAAFEFLVASGALNGSVMLYDMLRGDERAPLSDENSATPVSSMAFSPDGTKLAAGGGSTIRLWDVEAATVQATLETEIGDISSLSFSPDGSRLVYGGADPAAWVWDLAGDNHALLNGHVDQVFALAYSADGQVIVSGDSGSVRLWDAATGANLAALPTPSGEPVNSVAISPDGTLIASGSDSGGAVLWGTSAAGGASEEAAASETTTSTDATTSSEETTTTSVSSCAITASGNANLRGGPGTDFERAGVLSAGQSAQVDGQAQGADGMTWYHLADGTWVRSDVVGSPAECGGVPGVTL